MGSQLTGQARGRLRRLNRLERLERPLDQRALSLRLNASHRSGDRVIESHKLVIGYDAKRPLLTVPDLLLLRTERAALIGPNGTGKTTFLKTMLGELPALKGEAKLGAAVKVAYFAQAHEGLDPEKTALDELMDAKADLKLSEARDILGRFLFSGDDHYKKIGVLSGGERGRVALAKLTLQGANLLLLDEPTNHLDIPSQEVITEALQHFDGTLLFVSHDRYLIAALATQLWMLERDEQDRTSLNVFRGTYDEWRNKRDEDSWAAKEASAKGIAKTVEKRQAVAATLAAPTPAAAPSGLSKNQQQQRIAKLEAVEKRIAELEHKLSALGFDMEAAANDYAKLQTLAAAYKQTEDDLVIAWRDFEALG
jgi:ATP-binding cassette subfamily F protein 3